MGHKGWISLHRKITDNWLYPTNEDKEFSKFEAWIDILLMVNHEERKVMLGNKLVNVKKGQRITSLRKLANRWSWSRNKVNSFLYLLEQDNMIKLEKDTQKTVITVVNYDVYQHDDITKRTRQGHDKDTERTQKDTNNNDNNENNDNKDKVRKYVYEQPHLDLAELLYKKILENNPSHKKPNLESWANTFRLMMEIDKRPGKKIQDLILWTQGHHFWHVNILSAHKLRKQYDRLLIEMKKDAGGMKNERNKRVHGNDYSQYDFSKAGDLQWLQAEDKSL